MVPESGGGGGSVLPGGMGCCLECPDLLHGRCPLGEQVGAPALGGVSYMHLPSTPRLAGKVTLRSACHQEKAFCCALVASLLLTGG